MISHAVVAFPQLSVRDQAWIESFRRQHDPQSSLIAAHFTLVFPAPVPAPLLVSEAHRSVAGQEPFRVELASAVVHRDLRAPRSYVFLLPSLGGDQIRQLHRRMYESELRQHLDPAIPYLPHVTVAAADHGECIALANEINSSGVSLDGTIDEMEIVSIDGQTLTRLAVVGLDGRVNLLPQSGGCER